VSFLRSLEGFRGVLVSLFGVLVSAQVILFSVVRGCGAMSVGGLLVELSRYSMGIIWHGVLLSQLF
jgi:hypothetical protein